MGRSTSNNSLTAHSEPLPFSELAETRSRQLIHISIRVLWWTSNNSLTAHSEPLPFSELAEIRSRQLIHISIRVLWWTSNNSNDMHTYACRIFFLWKYSTALCLRAGLAWGVSTNISNGSSLFWRAARRHESYHANMRRGGGLGSSTIFKKFNEPYAPS